MTASAKTVAIIGAGPSGLAACKAALEEGLAPTVFEQAEGVGGLWHPVAGKVWNSLHTNLSKYTCAFSDQPWPQDTPDFPSAADVQQYLHNFAEVNGLLQYVKFGASVCRVEPVDEMGRSWQVSWERAATFQDEGVSRTFDFCIVATGIFTKNYQPQIPGLDKFRGTITHAADYREPAQFKGKRVLVVGAAFSGADIAEEVSRVAKSVTIVAKRPLWYLPRYIKKLPADLVFYSRAGAARNANKTKEEQNAGRHVFFQSVVGNLPEPLTAPDLDKGELPFVAITDAFLGAVKDKHVSVRTGSVDALSATGAVFSSGDPQDFDAVLFATGYRLEMPFLSQKLLEDIEFHSDDWLQPVILHECVWPPSCLTLAFVGLYRGPYFAAMELQARWACGVFSGRLGQPTKEEVAGGLEMEREIREATPRPQFPHGDYVSMADALARRVKVHPEEMMKDEASEMYDLLHNGPLLPFHYRLVGFASKPDVAKQAILECREKRRRLESQDPSESSPPA